MNTCEHVLTRVGMCLHALSHALCCLVRTAPVSYTHTCIHTYMHTCSHTYIHACIHTYMHAYIHTYMHTCMHACIHTYRVPQNCQSPEPPKGCTGCPQIVKCPKNAKVGNRRRAAQGAAQPPKSGTAKGLPKVSQNR